MPRYLYEFIELLSYIGDGTPQNPGGDFTMCVWIDADDVEQARSWGRQILHQFVRERFRHSDPDVDPTGYEGEIVEDAALLESRKREAIPVCKVGEIPQWTEPWKNFRASGPPRRIQPSEGT
jgi:hypothetical protein